jgi:catechol 2,3-dioxygenase-like lactoylglutathione lyase family enzyme
MTSQDPAVGDLRVGTVVVNVADMSRAVTFWCSALGYRPRDVEWDATFMVLRHPHDLGVPLSLQLSEGQHHPARVHLDLYTSEQAGQVRRLVELGATPALDWPYPDDPDFVVLEDPDGNVFCVIDHPETA